MEGDSPEIQFGKEILHLLNQFDERLAHLEEIILRTVQLEEVREAYRGRSEECGESTGEVESS